MGKQAPAGKEKGTAREMGGMTNDRRKELNLFLWEG